MESMDMRKLVVGVAAAGATLGAGFGLANAQTDPPATQAPSTPTPDDGDRGHGGRFCDKDGDGQPDAERTRLAET